MLFFSILDSGRFEERPMQGSTPAFAQHPKNTVDDLIRATFIRTKVICGRGRLGENGMTKDEAQRRRSTFLEVFGLVRRYLR
jgi:hypothetical protein